MISIGSAVVVNDGGLVESVVVVVDDSCTVWQGDPFRKVSVSSGRSRNKMASPVCRHVSSTKISSLDSGEDIPRMTLEG